MGHFGDATFDYQLKHGMSTHGNGSKFKRDISRDAWAYDDNKLMPGNGKRKILTLCQSRRTAWKRRERKGW